MAAIRKKKQFLSLPLRILIALILGTLTGMLLGERAEWMGEVGGLMVRLLKALATPLIFFAITDTLSSHSFPRRKGGKLIFISLCNACVAASIAIGLAHLWPAGRLIHLDALQALLGHGSSEAAPLTEGLKLDGLGLLKSLIPQNVVDPFVGNQTLPVVLLALLIGFAARKIRNPVLAEFFSGGFKLLGQSLRWVVQLVPFAVFGVVARAVGLGGVQVFAALGVFVGIVAAGMALHVFGYYSVLLTVFARKSPFLFFRQAARPLATAFATGSSLATLPVTLETLDQEMGVGIESSRLAACIGTNLNHDGILLYEAAAALFVAQIYGISLDTGMQFRVALSAALAAVGIAGIPDAGLITLSLVLTSVGLPLTVVPFLLPVDWLIGRFRSTTNVASDLVVANLLDQ